MYIFIDDEPICNLISKKILTLHYPDSKIISFESALDAIQYFEANLDQLQQHKILISLDINMPEMNGFEFLVEFENRFEKILNAEVFILSSSHVEKDRSRANQFKVVKNYYTKPFQISYVQNYF